MDEYKVSPIIVITSIQERNILLDAFGLTLYSSMEGDAAGKIRKREQRGRQAV